MRKIINISLPQELNNEVDNVMKTGNYTSKSEFSRQLIRNWKEDRLWRELKESQKEIKSGNGKILRSLKSLR